MLGHIIISFQYKKYNVNKTSCVFEISEKNAVNLAMLYVANEWGRSVYGFAEHSLPQALPLPVLQVAYLGIYKNGMTIVFFSAE